MSAHRYRVVVNTALGPRYSSGFERMTVVARDGTRKMSGLVIDSSGLQGLLERIAGSGLALHSVTLLDTGNGEADAHTHTTSQVGETGAGIAWKGL